MRWFLSVDFAILLACAVVGGLIKAFFIEDDLASESLF